MRKIFLIIFIILFQFTISEASNSENYKYIREKMEMIPDSSTKSTTSIANYIDRNFKNENEKIRAIFLWITKNIVYDQDYKYVAGFNDFTVKTIEQTLQTKKAVCVGYAGLLNDIAEKVGLSSYIVVGYVKQESKILEGMHAWNAVKIDGQWKLFDVTWGTGYILNGIYQSDFDESFFDVRPEKMIKSHKPFDPIWQMLNYLWTDKEFEQGKEQQNAEKIYFNYADSIDTFLEFNEFGKTKAIVRRMEENGLSNALIINWHDYYKKMMHFYQNSDFVTKFNEVVTLYNKAVKKYAAFIKYRGEQFKPAKPESLIRNMIMEADSLYTKSYQIIQTIIPYDEKSIASIKSIKVSVKSGMQKVEIQKRFVDKYFTTPKTLRVKLFYQ